MRQVKTRFNCCAGVYLAYAPLDFEDGVRALSLTASLATLVVAGLTEDERCPVHRGGQDVVCWFKIAMQCHRLAGQLHKRTWKHL